GGGDDGSPRSTQRCWIGDLDGEPVGSILCTREDDETARLRCLLVHPDARGLGLGARLVTTCVTFARERGYRRMVLTTVDLLHGARRLYEAAGFEMATETPGPLFGSELNVQEWTLEF
ncbi:MAG: GNAT family N-acetyltransferase, partial [Gemmatimonadetes bacterium]|nr:GNAT family N-acetyltransferase [Gemmatimonadota bacterium]